MTARAGHPAHQGARGHNLDLDSLFTAVAMRLFFPELRPTPLAEVDAHVPTRLYLGVRLGGALTTNSQVFPGVGIKPVPAAYGSRLGQFFGLSAGMDLHHYFGLELGLEGYEVALKVPDPGGAGVDVFVAHNIAIGFETKYLTSRAHTLTIDDDRKHGGTLQAIVFSFGLRVFLASLKR